MASAPATQLTGSDAADLPVPKRRSPKDVRVALWPIVVVLYATLLPREMRVSVTSLDFFADRIGLIIALPYVLRKVMDGAIRFVIPDALVLFNSMWMVVSMMAAYGFTSGLERGGSLALDASVGYLLARISFRSLDDMRRVFILFAPGIFIAASFVFLESVTHRYLVHPISEQIFGRLKFFVGTDPTALIDRRNYMRLGLMRGLGPFTHQIHAGVYLATMIPIYLMSSLRGWPKWIGLAAGLMAFFSVSSAALLGMALAFALVGYDFFQRRIRELSWTLLVLLAVVVLIFLQVLSDSGAVSVFTRYLTLDPQTAQFRQLIWQFGLQSVWKYPLFGIGFEPYEHPDWMITSSIDAQWLAIAVRFGIISPILLLTAVIMALAALGRASVKAPPADQRFYRGIAFALFIIAFSMFTVALWGGIQNWFTILLGGCVACAQRNFAQVRFV